MIEPTRITNFNRTTAELEEFLLFGIAVAGKKAIQTRDSLNDFLDGMLPGETPFGYITRLEDRGWLLPMLKECKLSPYGTRYNGFLAATLKGDLRTVTVEELDDIPGVGPKTARFFVVHSREGARHAVLDTHILAWMRDQGYRAPKQTPQSPSMYTALEDSFLHEADARGLTPAELDLQIWVERSNASD